MVYSVPLHILRCGLQRLNSSRSMTFAPSRGRETATISFHAIGSTGPAAKCRTADCWLPAGGNGHHSALVPTDTWQFAAVGLHTPFASIEHYFGAKSNDFIIIFYTFNFTLVIVVIFKLFRVCMRVLIAKF